MKTTTIRILAAFILVLSVAVPFAAAANESACTKSFLIELGLAKTGTEIKAVQVVYSKPPVPDGGGLNGTVLRADGSTLSSFSLRDPRDQFGDELKVSEDGKNSTALTGIQVTEDHADLVVMFPYTPEARTFVLRDPSGTVLASVDLTKAVDKATWDCRAGWGVTTPRAAAAAATTTKAPAGPWISIASFPAAVWVLARGRR